MKKLLMFAFTLCMGFALLYTSVPTDAQRLGPPQPQPQPPANQDDHRDRRHGHCRCHELSRDACHRCPNCRWHQERHQRRHNQGRCVAK